MKKRASVVTLSGMDEGERIQFFYHQHWMRLRRAFQAFALGTALYVAALWFLSGMPDPATRRFLLVTAIFSFFLLQMTLWARFYGYLLYIIVVTDTKIYRIKKTLLMLDDRQTVDLWNLSDVTMRQHGLFQNLFGFGTVVLHGNDELRIHFTPKIRSKIHLLATLRTKARSRALGGVPDRDAKRTA